MLWTYPNSYCQTFITDYAKINFINWIMLNHKIPSFLFENYWCSEKYQVFCLDIYLPVWVHVTSGLFIFRTEALVNVTFCAVSHFSANPDFVLSSLQPKKDITWNTPGVKFRKSRSSRLGNNISKKLQSPKILLIVNIIFEIFKLDVDDISKIKFLTGALFLSS